LPKRAAIDKGRRERLEFKREKSSWIYDAYSSGEGEAKFAKNMSILPKKSGNEKKPSRK